MPAKFLEYVARLNEKLIPEEKRYRQKLIRLPRPEFYVFYNGEADCPAEKSMCLSSAFSSGGGGVKAVDSPLELSVKVYNINRRDEIPFVRQCAPLSGYSRLVEYARKAKKEGVDGWLDYAAQKCIREGILTNYLKRNSTEVRNMLFGEYDYETDIREKQQA